MCVCGGGGGGDFQLSPVPMVLKLFPCSTQLSNKFILPIDIKLPTVVGILTFIGRLNTISERYSKKLLHLSVF